MPELDEQSLLDNSRRIDLYSGQQPQQAQAPETAPEQILQTPEEQQEYNDLLEMMNSLPQS